MTGRPCQGRGGDALKPPFVWEEKGSLWLVTVETEWGFISRGWASWLGLPELLWLEHHRSQGDPGTGYDRRGDRPGTPGSITLLLRHSEWMGTAPWCTRVTEELSLARWSSWVGCVLPPCLLLQEGLVCGVGCGPRPCVEWWEVASCSPSLSLEGLMGMALL